MIKFKTIGWTVLLFIVFVVVAGLVQFRQKEYTYLEGIKMRNQHYRNILTGVYGEGYSGDVELIFGCITTINSRIYNNCGQTSKFNYRLSFKLLQENGDLFFNSISLCVPVKGFASVKGRISVRPQFTEESGDRYVISDITQIDFYDTRTKKEGGGGVLCSYKLQNLHGPSQTKK
ncbi:MAG: hypothetical protein ACWA5R_02555 [bacterium]